MAHNWQQAASWANYSLDVKDKRTGQSGRLTGYGRLQWQQVQRHPTHGWDYPTEETPYFFTYQMERLTALFPISTGDRILIIGSGLGYFIEALRDAGYTLAYGMEPHVPLQDRIDAEARADVITIKKTFGANTIPNIQAEMVALTGAATFKWIVTWEIMQRYSDANLSFLANDGPTFLEGGQPQTNIINCVVPAQYGRDENGNPDPTKPRFDPDYFFRTLAEYQAIVPNQTIVDTTGSWAIYSG